MYESIQEISKNINIAIGVKYASTISDNVSNFNKKKCESYC